MDGDKRWYATREGLYALLPLKRRMFGQEVAQKVAVMKAPGGPAPILMGELAGAVKRAMGAVRFKEEGQVACSIPHADRVGDGQMKAATRTTRH